MLYPDLIKCKSCEIERSHENFQWKSNGEIIKYMCHECKEKDDKLNYLINKLKYPELIQCKKCSYERTHEYFQWRLNGKINSYRCSICKNEESRLHYEENKEDIQKQHNQYYQNHKEARSIYFKNNKEKRKEYDKNHKEEKKEYNKNYRNKPENKVKRSENRKKKIINDPSIKLKQNISNQIRVMLKSMNSSKQGQSSSSKVPFNKEELKIHIENLFSAPYNLTSDGKVWMTFENYGKYNPNKKTWQLDHIIPQSDLPYASMDDENFKKCWNLNNLRPLESMQNIIDGATRVRHQKRTT